MRPCPYCAAPFASRASLGEHLLECGMPDHLELAELILELRFIRDPVELVREIDTVGAEVASALSRIRAAAVYEATRRASYDDVAAPLGVGTAAVNKAVSRHLQPLWRPTGARE